MSQIVRAAHVRSLNNNKSTKKRRRSARWNLRAPHLGDVLLQRLGGLQVAVDLQVLEDEEEQRAVVLLRGHAAAQDRGRSAV